MRIEHVLETHNHADHVSGHGRLVAATRARIHIHRDAEPDYGHEPFGDGWELKLGSVTVRALHTPGHRPEHTAFALVDTARSDEPWAVLTGDSLFVGDIARPDLAVDREEGARGIFRSLNDRLMRLPDTCEVWPGHLGGSLCGGPGMDLKVSSTVGFERANHDLLQVTDVDDFVARTTSALGPQPPNFESVVALNRGPLVEWDAGHIPGSVHAPYHDIVGIPEGIDFRRPVAVMCASGQRAAVAASLLQRYGAQHVIHVVDGGVPRWKREGGPTEPARGTEA